MRPAGQSEPRRYDDVDVALLRWLAGVNSASMVMVISSPTTPGALADAKILTMIFGGRRCADALAGPIGSLIGAEGPIHVEHDFLGHAVNGQVAGDQQFSGPGRSLPTWSESNGRILLHIEKVRALQIVVAHFHARIHGTRVDRSFERVLRRVCGIMLHRPTHFRESAPDRRDAEVSYGKLRRTYVWDRSARFQLELRQWRPSPVR